MIRTRVVAVGLAALALPMLAGCGVHQTGGTFQSASGNGRVAEAPGVEVDDATLVAGGAGTAAFLGTVTNTSTTDDQLIAIVAGDRQATLAPTPIPLPRGRGVAIQTGQVAQAQFTGLTAEPGTYVPVRMVFRTAGEVTFDALLVPPTGFYRDAAPEAAPTPTTTQPASPTPEPSIRPAR